MGGWVTDPTKKTGSQELVGVIETGRGLGDCRLVDGRCEPADPVAGMCNWRTARTGAGRGAEPSDHS